MSELRLSAEIEQKPAETNESWQTKLLDYAYQLSILKVVTYVGGAEIETNDAGLVSKVTITPSGKPLLTIINLVDGDLTNVVDPSLTIGTTASPGGRSTILSPERAPQQGTLARREVLSGRGRRAGSGGISAPPTG